MSLSSSVPPLISATMWSGTVVGRTIPFAAHLRQRGSAARRRARCSTAARSRKRSTTTEQPVYLASDQVPFVDPPLHLAVAACLLAHVEGEDVGAVDEGVEAVSDVNLLRQPSTSAG